MAGEWQEMSFSEAVLVNPRVELKRGVEYPFVDMQSVNTGSRCAYASEQRAFEGGGSRFAVGDTLMARITPCLENGKMARFCAEEGDQVAHGSTEFIVIRGRDDVTLTDYAYYLTKWDSVSGYAISQMTGTSGRQRVPTDSLDHLRIPIPSIPEQRAMSHILGTLDDKIELNRQMNETLEAMARAISKSWFVDFDPVRAKSEGRKPSGMDAHTAALFPDSFQDSPLGKIPNEWKVITLGEVIKIHDMKRIPLSSRQRAERRGPYPYYGAASVMDYVDDYLFDGVYVLVGEDGSVVSENDTPVVQYVWGKFWVNNHAHVLLGKNDISLEHLLLFLRQTNIPPFVTGAVQPKLNQGNLCRIPFLLPQSNLCSKFGTAMSPLFEKFRANVDQSRTLAAIRDALLPKLLSGEIRVRNMESLEATATAKPKNRKIGDSKTPERKAPNEFVEAVLIAVLVRDLSIKKHPVGRKRYQKFSYFVHRRAGHDVVQGYLKKAAGPYNPRARYGGPEDIALKNGYVKKGRKGNYEGFVTGPQINKAARYFSRYQDLLGPVQWAIERFRYTTNDDLELFSTVDYAVLELEIKQKPITLKSICALIANDPEWSPKLSRDLFSKSNIQRALNDLKVWFPETYKKVPRATAEAVVE